MPIKTPSRSELQLFTADADNFTAEAATHPALALMSNLKEWGELAQNQAHAMQAVAADSVESFKRVKEPKAAFQNMKANAEKIIALTAKHLHEVAGLGVGQFRAGVDLIQTRHPAPDAFRDVAKIMRVAASRVESATISSLNAGNSASASPPR